MWKISITVLIILLVSCRCNKFCTSKDKHWLGERFGGGIVFYVEKDSYHGLIASIINQGINVPWFNGKIQKTGASYDGLYKGRKNTEIIMKSQINDTPGGSFAAKLCSEYKIIVDGKTYDDWYLPSKYELYLLYKQKNVVGIINDISQSPFYWSSTETNNNTAVAQNFIFGDVFDDSGKGNLNMVRAIRSF